MDQANGLSVTITSEPAFAHAWEYLLECIPAGQSYYLGVSMRISVPSNEVWIEDLAVSDDDVVGEVGRGFKYLLDGLRTVD